MSTCFTQVHIDITTLKRTEFDLTQKVRQHTPSATVLMLAARDQKNPISSNQRYTIYS